jgi:hypothetical protein
MPLQSSLNLNKLLAENKSNGFSQVQAELQYILGNNLAIKDLIGNDVYTSGMQGIKSYALPGGGKTAFGG